MDVIERRFTVDYALRVYFTRRVFEPSNPLLREVLTAPEPRRRHKALVVADESLMRAQPRLGAQIQGYFEASPRSLQLVCEPLLIEGGERCKNSYFHVSEIQSRVERFGLCRHSYVIGVGGGALLDVAGLAAATAHRGLRHVRVPTTTLSQDDSGVGVKNGINAFGKKNFIGAFAPPFAVINDAELLASLAPRDKRAGYVEAVKVALIRDADFFAALERDAEALRGFDPDAMERLIRRCAELHVQHIATAGDPFEFGSARPLDFGHWSAHKLEQLSEFKIRHGEAVAMGIALDVLYARRVGMLGPLAAERALALLERLGFELYSSEMDYTDSEGQHVLLRGLEEFREHLGGELAITLLEAIGRGVEVREIDPREVIGALRELRERSAVRGPAAATEAGLGF
jgi:3-dehydroquinate synthase